MCMLISIAMEKIIAFKVGTYVEKVLAVLGSYSFEIFLVHALMFDIYRAFFIATDPKYNWDMYWYIVIFLITPCCIAFIALNKFINKMLNIIKEKISAR